MNGRHDKAAYLTAVRVITASMECSGTQISGEDGCGRHDKAAYLTAVRMMTASMECSGIGLNTGELARLSDASQAGCLRTLDCLNFTDCLSG